MADRLSGQEMMRPTFSIISHLHLVPVPARTTL